MRQMKDSGIPWIGYIPTTWKVRAIRYGFEVGSGSTPSSTNFEYWDGEIPWVTPADFKTEDRIVNEGRRFISKKGYASCGTRLVKEGSLIFSKRAPIGSVVLSGQKLCTNQGCFWCTPKTADVDSVFFYYTMSIYPEVFNLFGSGTTFREISADTFKNVKLSLPPYDEQKHIAAFLDDKCAEIDALTADVQKEIETLQEYRRSLITEAVTECEAPYVRFKYCASVKSNLVAPDNYMNYPQVSPETIEKDTGRLLKDAVCSVEDSGIISGNHLFFKGQILYSKIRPILNKVTIAPFDGLCSADMYPIETVNDSHYIMYAMLSKDFLRQVKSVTENRVKMPKINQEELADIRIHLPSIADQHRIADFLDKKCAEIDSILETKQKQLETLAEYRKSLIYEYVTGKKEVV